MLLTVPCTVLCSTLVSGPVGRQTPSHGMRCTATSFARLLPVARSYQPAPMLLPRGGALSSLSRETLQGEGSDEGDSHPYVLTSTQRPAEAKQGRSFQGPLPSLVYAVPAYPTRSISSCHLSACSIADLATARLSSRTTRADLRLSL